MQRRSTPLSWRKDWVLYRAKSGTNGRGDPVRTYDMATPDYTGTAGTASGVSWLIERRETTLMEYGDKVTASASFQLDLPALGIGENDRCVFGGRTWEVRGVLERSDYRTVKLVQVG